MELKILVAAHREYWMPEDSVYMPLQVGRALHGPLPGMTGDDTGENISQKNPYYCELTGLFWAWKNLSCSHIGLCHYRRYFAKRSGPMFSGDRRSLIMQGEDYARILAGCDIILPKKRRYFIETVRSHYGHAHRAEDLEECGRALREVHPRHARAFDRVMGSTSLYIFNMAVMRRDLFERYCEWLFPVLFELERRIDLSGRSAYDARVFGFLGERLFNVWLEGEVAKRAEVPVVCLEKTDWMKKGSAFLRRKCGLGGRAG